MFLYELIEYYGYPKERIRCEQDVNFGREKKRADIIVYQNDKNTPWIVIEVKAPNQKNDIQQLKSYLNAEGSPIGVGINGKDITILYRPYPKEFDSTLPDIPFNYEYQQVKDDPQPAQKIKDVVLKREWTIKKLKETNKIRNFDLRSIIEELEELVLANSGVDSFYEIFKLIYSKLYDEFEAQNRKNEALFFRQYSTPEITYKEISKLFEEAKDLWKDVFDSSDKIKLTPEHLDVCVGKLTEVELFGANLRIIDEAFEYLVPEVAKGKKGQYFTPRIIIEACVRMLNPKRREYVLDPACGSAGFLVHTMDYIWKKYNLKDYRSRSNYSEKYLWGIDFDERSTKISKAIMLIAGDGKTHIYRENSLEYLRWNIKLRGNLEEEKLSFGDTFKELKFDIIMTNPPFAGEIKEKQLINSYMITEGKEFIDRHILFTERVIDMLKPGGRCAIVLPQGIFNNKNEDYVRQFISKRARIMAVIGLHGNSFKPHTGTKTSLMFLRKWRESEIDAGGNPKLKDYPIFLKSSRVSFKNNSGEYIYMSDGTGSYIRDTDGNRIYQTDLLDISDAFISWGKKQFERGDSCFDFIVEDI